jgi:hypothetical protein
MSQNKFCFFFLERREKAGFIGENALKIFESGTTGEVENRIFEGEERGKLGLRKTTLACKVLGMKGKQWEKAKALYLAGKSWKAIADETGIVQSTLQSKASRDDWTKFRKGMRDTISSNEIQSLESLSALVRSKLAADAASTLERVDSYDLDGIKDEATRETILNSVAKRSALVFGWSEAGEATSVSINLLGSMPDRFAEVVVSK